MCMDRQGVALLYMFISNGVKRVHVIDNMHLTKYLNISNPEDIWSIFSSFYFKAYSLECVTEFKDLQQK